jgi:hypothetical protein
MLRHLPWEAVQELKWEFLTAGSPLPAVGFTASAEFDLGSLCLNQEPDARKPFEK